MEFYHFPVVARSSFEILVRAGSLRGLLINNAFFILINTNAELHLGMVTNLCVLLPKDFGAAAAEPGVETLIHRCF